MEPSGWGPPMWSFLHGLVSESSEAACKAQKRILLVLRELLPCTKCRFDYLDYTRSIPDCAENRLAQYLSDLHNWVNAKLNKPIYPMDFYPAPKQDDAFAENMFYSLFVLAEMYPKHFALGTRHAKNMHTLLEQLPIALTPGSLSQCIQRHPPNKLTLANKQNLMTWLYNVYTECIPGPKPTLEEIQETMESMRIKNDETPED